MTQCHLCGAEIGRPEKAYREITGYVKLRKSGGANQVTLKRETGQAACDNCIERGKSAQSSGPIEGQMTFDEAVPELAYRVMNR